MTLGQGASVPSLVTIPETAGMVEEDWKAGSGIWRYGGSEDAKRSEISLVCKLLEKGSECISVRYNGAKEREERVREISSWEERRWVRSSCELKWGEGGRRRRNEQVTRRGIVVVNLEEVVNKREVELVLVESEESDEREKTERDERSLYV